MSCINGTGKVPFHNVRVRAVLVAQRIANENNIFQAHKQHAWSILYGNGLLAQRGTEPLENFASTVQSFYTRFARDAAHSMLSHGYFAYVYTVVQPHGCKVKLTIPLVLMPDLYFIVSQQVLQHHFPDLARYHSIRGGYHVLFIRKEDEDLYGIDSAMAYVEYAPTDRGVLTCPAAKIYDMHDFSATHNQLHMVAANINVVPKAWLSQHADSRNGLFTGDRWGDRDTDASGAQHGISDRQPRVDLIAAENEVSEARRIARFQTDDIEAMRQDERKPIVPGLDAFVVRSRTMDVSSQKDPTCRYMLANNTHITPVPAVTVADDIIAYTNMQDRRIAVTLGLPLGLIGMGEGGKMMETGAALAYHQYKLALSPLRHQINASLICIVEDLFTGGSKKAFLTTKDDYYLQPVTIELVALLDSTQLDSLLPYLTPEAAARHLAALYDIDETDFDPTRFVPDPVEPPKKKAKKK